MKESTEFSFELSRWQNRHFGHISMIKEKGFSFGILIEINCREAEGNKSEFAINFVRRKGRRSYILLNFLFCFEYARAYIGSTRTVLRLFTFIWFRTQRQCAHRQFQRSIFYSIRIKNIRIPLPIHTAALSIIIILGAVVHSVYYTELQCGDRDATCMQT